MANAIIANRTRGFVARVVSRRLFIVHLSAPRKSSVALDVMLCVPRVQWSFGIFF
jgi:hypothetical protein